MYFTVEVDGETRVWLTLDYAFTDVFSRGFMKDEWTITKHVGEPS